MAKQPKTLGFIIDRGNSPIDGKPFVAILTVKSSNRKTGNMAQVFILREDINPVAAVNTGEDVSICGDCPHRKQKDGSRSCYVNVGQAPNSVWKSYKAGKYTDALASKDGWNALGNAVKGRKIRWGAYGDPAILDFFMVEYLNSLAIGHTGYTHQWRQPFAAIFVGIFQASCDGLNDYLDATAHGWKTFVVVAKNSVPAYAKQCPATVNNSKAQCITCSLCDGAKKDIYVQAHGSGAKYVSAV